MLTETCVLWASTHLAVVKTCSASFPI